MNTKVAEKERESRFIEIYKNVDPKSWATYMGKKFKKSDMMLQSRRLMFEGSAVLHVSRGKAYPVTVVVLSDVMFFLNESNPKSSPFVAFDNKVRVHIDSLIFTEL